MFPLYIMWRLSRTENNKSYPMVNIAIIFLQKFKRTAELRTKLPTLLSSYFCVQKSSRRLHFGSERNIMFLTRSNGLTVNFLGLNNS